MNLYDCNPNKLVCPARENLQKRVAQLETALTYIARETGAPLGHSRAACELAHNIATEALKP